MPDHLKNATNSKEFDKYLKSFRRRKERQHRHKVMGEIATSVALMIAN